MGVFKNSSQLQASLSFLFISALSFPIHLPAFSADLSEYDSICGSIVTGTQKETYCKAAKTSIEAMNQSQKVMVAWSVTAGVCGAICAASAVGVALPLAIVDKVSYVCPAAQLGAAAAQGALTQDFANSLMSAGMSIGPSLLMGNKSSSQETPTEDVQKTAAQTTKTTKTKLKTDAGACIGAAMGAMQAYTSYSSIDSNKSSAESNLDSARNIIPSYTPTVVSTGVPEGPAIRYGTSTHPNTQSEGTSAPGSSSSFGACGSSSSSFGMAIECATASDSTLPSGVGSTPFMNDVAKLSGSQFDRLGSASNPAQAAQAALSGGLFSPDLVSSVGKAMQGMGDALASQGLLSTDSQGTYSGGGSRSGESSGSEDTGLQNLLSGFLGTGGKERTGIAPLTEIIFANKTKPIDSIPENRSLNLFARVSYRYYGVILNRLK